MSSMGNPSNQIEELEDSEKLEVFNQMLLRPELQEIRKKEANSDGFSHELWNHFKRLPTRYALYVSKKGADYILVHKELLELARDPLKRPVVDVHPVPVQALIDGKIAGYNLSNSMEEEVSQSSLQFSTEHSTHLPLAFGSSSNPEISSLGEAVSDTRSMLVITFSTISEPEPFIQLATSLVDNGLSIKEAHAFCTIDGFSLLVFVVDGYPSKDTRQLIMNIREKVSKPKEQSGTVVHEIDFNLLRLGKKFASGSSADLHKGIYCNKDVAVKIFSSDKEDLFHQEVSIMSKLKRHDNVVEFIGKCTNPTDPSKLYIITEYMCGGSLRDYFSRGKKLELPLVLKAAIDVSKGMEYLHREGIIHRDMKSANLLRDGNGMVKVVDFGVSRLKNQSEVMTPNTGTDRYMAPEVINNTSYDHKVDVFSFGLVLCEMLTGELPHAFLEPSQIVFGRIHQDIRPDIPPKANPRLAALIQRCWNKDPSERPEFGEITRILQEIEVEIFLHPKPAKKLFGFLSKLKK